jgi:membrane protein DedA with SNARE-associated domain
VAVGGLTEWVLSIVERLGYPAILLLVALENLVPPIPSEVILPLAGFLVGQGKFNYPAAVVAATLGSTLGALILYFIGREVGEERLRRFIRRYSWIPFLSEEDIDRGHDWFNRHGGATVLFGRLVPFVRSAISLPAGFAGMPLARFAAFTALGSALWNGVLIALGWWLGSQWESVRQYAQGFEYAVLALLAFLAGRFIWRRWRGRKEEGAGSRDEGKAPTTPAKGHAD